jgi:isopentenyldiphosphate isomerase
MLRRPADELIDQLDETGKVIGVVSRAEMRRRRLPHRCVYLLVFNSRGEVFIHQRTPTKEIFPAFWDVCVGGLPAAGEPFVDAVQREALEEIGVAVTPEELFPILYRDEQFVVHGMVYRAVHDGPFTFQAEEVARGEFVRVDELELRFGRERFCPDGQAVWAEFGRRFNF